MMWRIIYNNEANDGYHDWFEVVDDAGEVIVTTPKAEFRDMMNLMLMVSLSHFRSVLRYLKDYYSSAFRPEQIGKTGTEFIDWLEQHPHDWCLVTMVKNGMVFCRKCGKNIGTLELYGKNIIRALEFCRELALCEDCKEEVKYASQNSNITNESEMQGKDR